MSFDTASRSKASRSTATITDMEEVIIALPASKELRSDAQSPSGDAGSKSSFKNADTSSEASIASSALCGFTELDSKAMIFRSPINSFISPRTLTFSVDVKAELRQCARIALK